MKREKPFSPPTKPEFLVTLAVRNVLERQALDDFEKRHRRPREDKKS